MKTNSKFLTIIAIFIFGNFKLNAQDKAKIQWLTIDQAFEAIKKDPKK